MPNICCSLPEPVYNFIIAYSSLDVCVCVCVCAKLSAPPPVKRETIAAYPITLSAYAARIEGSARIVRSTCWVASCFTHRQRRSARTLSWYCCCCWYYVLLEAARCSAQVPPCLLPRASSCSRLAAAREKLQRLQRRLGGRVKGRGRECE